jgi:hypothetical protein
MMTKRTALFLVLLLLPALASAASATPLNFYLGASLGEEVVAETGDPSFDVSGDSAYKVFAGLKLGRILGVEVAYHDFGTQVCCPNVADYGFNLDVDGLSAAGVVGLSISRVNLFAKLGVFSWNEDGFFDGLIGRIDVSDDGQDLMGGVGAAVKLTDHFAVRAAWEYFEFAGSDVDFVSLGVEYKF